MEITMVFAALILNIFSEAIENKSISLLLKVIWIAFGFVGVAMLFMSLFGIQFK